MELSADLVKVVLEMKDRQDILDCIHRYSRGVDRADRELLLSVYHPDAIDDHGSFVGVAADFADWALAYHLENQVNHQHAILNHSCELDGDTAHTETYFLFEGLNKTGTLTLSAGRYIDRFERRNGQWKIAARVKISDWVAELGKDLVPPHFMAALRTAANTRDKTDTSYLRPLRITRPLTTSV